MLCRPISAFAQGELLTNLRCKVALTCISRDLSRLLLKKRAAGSNHRRQHQPHIGRQVIKELAALKPRAPKAHTPQYFITQNPNRSLLLPPEPASTIYQRQKNTASLAHLGESNVFALSGANVDIKSGLADKESAITNLILGALNNASTSHSSSTLQY